VWVVDDDRSIRWVLEKALGQSGMQITSFDSADAVLRRLDKAQPDAVISDIRMPGTNGLRLLEHIKENFPELPVIIMTAYAELDQAVAAYQGGAFEYLPKPFDVDEAVTVVRRALTRREVARHENLRQAQRKPPEIIGAAASMQEVFRAIGRLSRSNMTVLLTGESGTGKELVARALHRHSPRSDKPFIPINTAAIPRELLESEFFGHERGAFTGATTQRIGRFEQAHTGALFLDEIGDMPAELQTRLLRVLADGEFYRVGGHVPIKVDVRVIAATHQNLEVRVQRGEFREDLYHRLNVIRIHLPPLRERREDISALAEHFLTQTASELGVEPKVLGPESAQYIANFQWPGNVRQLENVCRWITVMAPSRTVHIEDLPAELRNREPSGNSSAMAWEDALRIWGQEALMRGETQILDKALPMFEKVLIDAALARTGGRRQDAAKLLGWGRNTLTRKLKALGHMEDDEDDDAGAVEPADAPNMP
jgi:two-component system nitrogen regulation response regulator GlnG